MAEIAFRGGSISFEEQGKGSAVVLLHGFLESKDIWKEYSDKLKNHYRVISIDLPGHGHTSNFGYSHSMEMMADCVQAVLKSLKIKKFHVIGHSLGGYVAMALGDKFPDKIKGICLFHSTVSDDSPQKVKEREKLIRLVERNKDLFINEAVPNLFNTKDKPYKTAISSIKKIARKTSVQGIVAALEGMKIRENRELILKFAPYPILYLIGKYDNIIPYQKLISESAISENAQFVLLEQTGHMGFIEEPEKCLNAIRVFLRRRG